MLAYIMDLRRCSGGVGSPPPRLRAGTAPARAGPAYAPASSILRATIAVQSQVPRLVDDAHPAATQHRFDVVAGDLGRT